MAGDAGADLVRFAALLQEAELAVVVEGSHFDVRRRKAHHVLSRIEDPAVVAVTVLRLDRVRSEGLLNRDVLLAEPGRLIPWLGPAGGQQRFTGRPSQWPARGQSRRPSSSAVAGAHAGA
jgi:hypothetical protein